MLNGHGALPSRPSLRAPPVSFRAGAQRLRPKDTTAQRCVYCVDCPSVSPAPEPFALAASTGRRAIIAAVHPSCAVHCTHCHSCHSCHLDSEATRISGHSSPPAADETSQSPHVDHNTALITALLDEKALSAVSALLHRSHWTPHLAA